MTDNPTAHLLGELPKQRVVGIGATRNRGVSCPLHPNGLVAAEARPPRGPGCRAEGRGNGLTHEERMKDGKMEEKKQERVQKKLVELFLDDNGHGDDGGEGENCIVKGCQDVNPGFFGRKQVL